MCMDIFFDTSLQLHHKNYERRKYVPKSLPVSIPLSSNSVMAFRVSLPLQYSLMYKSSHVENISMFSGPVTMLEEPFLK